MCIKIIKNSYKFNLISKDVKRKIIYFCSGINVLMYINVSTFSIYNFWFINYSHP